MSEFSILVIDDEESQREPVRGFLAKKGFNAMAAASCDEAMKLFATKSVDLIVTDFKMPGKTGLDVLREAKAINPQVPVVITTAYGNIEGAVEIMKLGAFDYIQKPVDLGELLHIIENARERQDLINENMLLKRQLAEGASANVGFSSIISESPEMQAALNIAARVGNSKASVLIRGESGTGKELIAQALHFSSPRRKEPFVVVNCAALPESLFESELFGHEKGAFTGAIKQRIGKFEQADKGTLFIDEVGDIPLQVQVKILRMLQLGQIERLGGSKTLELDVRIVAATNRNIEEMIDKGEFREDLYYRLNVVTINIPPLRGRKSDIIPLVNHFVSRYSIINDKIIDSVTKEATETLLKYDYPGNVRELENIIQRAIVMSRDEYIKTSDLPANIQKPVISEKQAANCFDSIEPGDLNSMIEKLEIVLIEKALAQTGHNQVKAAQLLNITERTIRYKIAKYGIKN
jgi:DNA-binding NtrC family response regulator